MTGKARISKEIRDRLQNHALQDASCKNHPARLHIVEKRAYMTKRHRFVCAMLAKKCAQVPEGMQ